MPGTILDIRNTAVNKTDKRRSSYSDEKKIESELITKNIYSMSDNCYEEN